MIRASDVLRFAVAILVAVLVIAPIGLMFATSLKSDEQQILVDFGTWRAFWISPSKISL